MKQKKMKLYSILTFILTLLLCVSAASFIRYQSNLKKLLEQKTISMICEEANEASAILEMMVEEYSDQLNYIKNLCKIADTEKHNEILELLDKKNEANSYITLSISDAQGNLYLPSNSDANIAKTLFFQKASTSKDENIYIDLGTNPINQKNTFLLAESIFLDDIFQGMIILYCDADALLKFIGGESFNDSGTLMLFHEDGQAIGRNYPIKEFDGYEEVLEDIPFKNEEERQIFKQAMDTGEKYINFMENSTGGNCIYYLPTKYPGWNLLLTVDASYIKDDFRAINKDSFTFMILNVIIIGFAVAVTYAIYDAGRKIIDCNQLDPHTQLYNKSYAKYLAEEYINREGRMNNFACFFLDMDHFKKVNDTFGHQVGDQLLKDFSHELKNRFRESDIVSRFGGDEFFILMKNVSDKQNVAKKAEEIMNILSSIQNYDVTISIGIAMSPTDGKTYDELQKCADIALYLAKEGGKNKYCFYQLNDT